MRRPEPTGAASESQDWGWGRWAWRRLTSMRTAVVLLALLALTSVPGSLLPQRNVASDPNGVRTFQDENPSLAPWLDRFGFFDVYASPWFAAVYLLLLVSMTGCVLPRCARLWRAVRSAPGAAPTNLQRLEGHHRWKRLDVPHGKGDGSELQRAVALLRGRRYRVEVADGEVRAEKGYLREVGNLVFHLSLLVLLVGVGAGRLFGFEGRVAIAEGNSFTNVRSAYDAFTPSVWTDTDNLEPLTFTLDEFEAQYALGGARSGEPRYFNASLTYATAATGEKRQVDVQPNHPLDVNETKFFLTGHGYAPVVTVRDGRGDVAFSGPVHFLPMDSSYASDGVVKVPDALPRQLAFEGFLLPTAGQGPDGPYSAFPGALDPRLYLTAYTGDLGMDAGAPQSVFALDKAGLDQVTRRDGRPFAQALSVGDTMRLPDGRGSLTFDRVSQFANFQVAYDPGKEISLVAGVMLLVGLTASLSIRRRRIWVRATGDTLEVAGQSLTRWPLPLQDIEDLVRTLRPDTEPAEALEEIRS